jgi:hypothetical protein
MAFQKPPLLYNYCYITYVILSVKDFRRRKEKWGEEKEGIILDGKTK